MATDVAEALGDEPDADEAMAQVVENLPAAQYLILEVLAGRWRCGDDEWPFRSRESRPLRALSDLGLVTYRSGNIERTLLASLTDAGRAVVVTNGYLSDENIEWSVQRELLARVEAVRVRGRHEAIGFDMRSWVATPETDRLVRHFDSGDAQVLQRFLAARVGEGPLVLENGMDVTKVVTDFFGIDLDLVRRERAQAAAAKERWRR